MDELTYQDKLNYLAYYIYNIILILVFNYDDYYNKLFKNALKYGMSRNDFWYGNDWKEYLIYEDAYYERLHEHTHIQGYYNYIAFNTILSNAFSDKKKGNKPLNYPEYNLYQENMKNIDKVVKTTNTSNIKITKENLQQVYMNRLANCY